MEVSFQEHIGWIMMLSWISMNSSSQESTNILATTTTKSIIRTMQDSPTYYIHNGEIRSEIHLAVALRYFAGGSYLDITISHGIGKTDVYHSVWAVVHATNRCTRLQF